MVANPPLTLTLMPGLRGSIIREKDVKVSLYGNKKILQVV